MLHTLSDSLKQWLPVFFLQDYLKISESLDGPLNICSAFFYKDFFSQQLRESKEVVTVLNLLHTYLGTSVLFVYVFLLIFHKFL